MPVILNANETRLSRQGDGWMEFVLADSLTFGEPAMYASRFSFNPHALGPEDVHGDTEQLLYVISGSGVARVNGETHPLEPETMLWMEPGDHYQIQAGPSGLELLRGYAPGD